VISPGDRIARAAAIDERIDTAAPAPMSDVLTMSAGRLTTSNGEAG
jgi:hypothetical protein